MFGSGPEESKNHSEIDAAVLEALRRRKRGGRKNKGPFRRILAVPDLILEFQVEDMRENALRSLSGMLNDVRAYLCHMHSHRVWLPTCLRS